MWPMRSKMPADLLQSRKNGGRAGFGTASGKGRATMRVKVIWLCGLLAACSSGAVTVPEGAGVYEVPQGGTASTAGGGDFTSTIEGALAEPTADGLPAHYPGATLPSADGTGSALDDDQINLMQWTLEQQKIDAAVAERSSTRRAASSSWSSPGRCRTASRASTSRSTPSRAPTRRRAALRPQRRRAGRRRRQLRPLPRPRRGAARLPAGRRAAGGPLRPRPRRRRLRLQLRPGALPRAPTERARMQRGR